MMPLSVASIDEKIVIKKITGKDEVRCHLAELGFVVGQELFIVSKNKGNIIINVKGSRIAIDESMANRIMV